MEKNWKTYTLLALLSAILVGALVFALIGPVSYVASYTTGVIAGVVPLGLWYVWNAMETGMKLVWIHPEAIAFLKKAQEQLNKKNEEKKETEDA